MAIKAHGTGTRDNDLSEGRGLVKLFGEKLPPVISLKGAIGHTLGAAGAVETALWLSCCEEGLIPRSFGFQKLIRKSVSRRHRQIFRHATALICLLISASAEHARVI